MGSYLSCINIWLNAIYGFDSNDIFAVGEYGVILHYDGKSWANQESHVTHRLNRIWGSSHNNIYVSGDYGTILHYNGTEWKNVKLMLMTGLVVFGGLMKNIYLLWVV